ncbi:hypothetical protein DFP72DRAFT_1172365 [Ephemerocybe angulata]|uniref:Uncharacterized protein n=1 Tax=Ephemerocybe angulata TaxID=980116 RepID=A0A8H6HQF7_9AGAR|nr:hypothetical protein DFP72DRAFT_1172365 [Tulosesus angulatus]
MSSDGDTTEIASTSSDVSEGVASVEEIVMAAMTEEAMEAPARSMFCICCDSYMFGDMEFAPSACCNDLICGLCWSRIERNEECCPRLTCSGVDTMKKRRIIFNNNTDNLASQTRDYVRSGLLNSDPNHQLVLEDIRVLQARTDRQARQISEQSRFNVALEDQVQQMSNRVEAVNRESEVLRDIARTTQRQADEVSQSNDALAARIEWMKQQVLRIEAILEQDAGQSNTAGPSTSTQ